VGGGERERESREKQDVPQQSWLATETAENDSRFAHNQSVNNNN